MLERQRAAAMLASLVMTVLALGACGGGDDDLADAGPGGDAGPAADAAPNADADLRYKLSQTGLYTDLATETFNPDLVEFAPSHALWSDGATKRRWLLLPPGTQIDTSDMNHWEFPVGTKFFKEFSLDGVRLETRLIERLDDGDTESSYFAGAFVWLDDHSDAVFEIAGAMNVFGTDHDVPSATRCWTCHLGDTGHILGFSAMQLSRLMSPPTVDTLAAQGLLSDPPPAGTALGPPGDAVTADALGTLHANCGHCHNPLGSAFSDTQQILRLNVEDRDPMATTTWLTTVNQPLMYWSDPAFMYRIVPGMPDMSAISYRMSVRDGGLDQMPPKFATEFVDMVGLAAVEAWIMAM